MRIRTAIFGVYVLASVIGFAVLMGFVLHDVRLRYVEAMRRTMGDTAAFLAVFAGEGAGADSAWATRLAALPPKADLLRVFACDPAGRVLFDSAGGADVGRTYPWPMTGGGAAASENYTARNVAVVGDELRVAAFVRTNGAVVGMVGVGRPIASVAEGVSQARWRIVAIGLGIAAVMLVAGWWIAQRLTHSLERLTAHVQAVRDGLPSRPPASRAIEIKALARAFAEMRATLEGKAYVERYTQALAHEIKAPLAAIRGAAELLGEDLPVADREKFLGNLRAESARIQRIIDRMLELASLEARHGRIETEEIDLRAVVQEVVSGALGATAARRVGFAVVPGASPRVRGEKFLLTQALTNLVHNALEFSPPGGRVTVTLSTAAGRVSVTVDDEGPGVPDYALPRLFERFYSLPRPDTGRKGTGLGLSIAREIARLHGGDVRLANGTAGGAHAELVLPPA